MDEIDDLEIEETPKNHGSIEFREVHIITNNKVLKSLLPSLLKRFDCNYTQPNPSLYVIKEHDTQLHGFFIEKHDIYPKICVYVNRETLEEYLICEYHTD